MNAAETKELGPSLNQLGGSCSETPPSLGT